LSKPDPTTGLTGALAVFAARQWRDYRAREPGTCFADQGFALDLQQAYELQGAVSALRLADCDRVIGYKVGCIGAGTTAQFGMTGPICLNDTVTAQCVVARATRLSMQAAVRPPDDAC
jgi:2-keto-4-pentenoate hydratase